MPAAAWLAELRWANGRLGPASLVVWYRLREVQLHHVDLDVGFGPADWPESFAVRLAVDLARSMGDRCRLVLRSPEVGHDLTFGAPGGPLVSGPVRTAVAWLSGRGDGAGLTGTLPEVPAFG